MTIARTTVPGLGGGTGWHEIGYATGDTDHPLARVRVVPLQCDEPRIMEPNAPPVPGRVAVRMSVSLVDAAGQVRTVAGRLLLGPERMHARHFDAAAPFVAAEWIDGCAAADIEAVMRLARGMAAADAAGLLPPLPAEQPGA